MIQLRDNLVPIPDSARRMYVRMLGSWAQDLLELRRRGLDHPSHRSADSVFTVPTPAAVPLRRAA